MAFTGTCIFEADVGLGSATNGGGFDPANANMATDLAATSATGTAPVVTSVSYSFAATDVGHHVFVKSGTNWTPGWYPIASVSGGAATLNALTGAVRLVEPAATTYNAAAGCATTASPTAGTWTVDYSQGAAPYSYTDMQIDGTTNTKFTSSGHAVGKNLVGNVISVNSGTGFTVQRVLVSSVTGTTATCDKSLGTLSSTGGGGTPGGALSHPAIFWGVGLVSGMQCFVKYSATPYLFGASANVDGGKISFSSTIGDMPMQGYDVTRTLNNADANRPILRANADSITMYSVVNNTTAVAGFVFDNPAAHTAVAGFHGSSGSSRLSRCKFDGMSSTSAENTLSLSFVTDVEVVNSTSTLAVLSFPSVSSVRLCLVWNCPGTGVAITGNADVTDCVVYNVGGTGIIPTSNGNTVRRCLVHTTASHGISLSSVAEAEDCIVWAAGSSGTAYGVAVSGTFASNRLTRLRIGSSRTADYQPLFRADMVTGFVHLSSDPCTNAAGGDFTLNNNSGGGTLCRGLVVALPGGVTVSYPDAGAAQHSDASVPLGPIGKIVNIQNIGTY